MFFLAPLCQDKSSKCSSYDASYCSHYDHIKQQCPKTCNQCGKLLRILCVHFMFKNYFSSGINRKKTHGFSDIHMNCQFHYLTWSLK